MRLDNGNWVRIMSRVKYKYYLGRLSFQNGQMGKQSAENAETDHEQRSRRRRKKMLLIE